MEIQKSESRYERFVQWLEREGYGEEDVIIDSEGREYVFEDYEMGSPSEEDYQNEKRKLYLDY